MEAYCRLVLSQPADRHVLGMQWNGGIYIDTCLPFGLRSAPKLFDILAEFLAWVAKQSNLSFLIHYLDDFLTMEPPLSLTGQTGHLRYSGSCSPLLSKWFSCYHSKMVQHWSAALSTILHTSQLNTSTHLREQTPCYCLQLTWRCQV